MNIVQSLRYHTGLTQKDFAAMGGTSQSTIAAYETGAKSPTLRTIQNLAQSQGLEIVVTYMPQMSREDRRCLAFHQPIVEILRKDSVNVLKKTKHNLHKLKAMHPGAQILFEQWQVWLALPIESLIAKILDPAPEAREMRQVSPFSGLLSARQRTQVLQHFRKEYMI
ncbi:MAG: helix-turn-helix domain-containing protein [Gammaproteobacteria bacterium]|nr:helix-turn-helix domain-containing protein [Gammaproteobacteria bacterium]